MILDTDREYAATMKDAGSLLPRNEMGHPGDEDLVKRHLDCAVINYLDTTRAEQNLPSFDTLRGAFFEGGPLFPDAGVAEKTHIP